MAGDWIKMRTGLLNCPKVASMARAIAPSAGLSGLPRPVLRLVVVGALHSAWSAANEHTSAGVLTNATLDDVDDLVGIDGLGEAMQSVGWAVVDAAAKTVTFPNFFEWNTPGKDRTNAERQRRHRERNGSVTDRNGTVTRYAPVTVTTEKRREEIEKSEEQTAAQSPRSDRPADRPDRPGTAAAGIVWTPAGGWQGITDADREAWRVAYPAADLRVELAKAHEWLLSHPAKAKRSNWRRFLAGWLTRCQDRGGTHRDAPGRPAAQIRTPRPEFGGRQMSDEEFARAKRSAAQQQRLREEREAAERERRGGSTPEVPRVRVRGVREEFDQAAATAAAMAAIQGGDHADV